LLVFVLVLYKLPENAWEPQNAAEENEGEADDAGGKSGYCGEASRDFGEEEGEEERTRELYLETECE
jgi:hypothetical protein